jgi:biopolymer transport protein ExbB/TolQ
MLAVNAAAFALQKATTEGFVTAIVLGLLSLFSWTIIITKFRQLWIARAASKKFYAAYAETRDPLDIHKKQQSFEGSPAYQLYMRGAEELAYQHKNNPVTVKGERRISRASFEAVKVVLEEAAGEHG